MDLSSYTHPDPHNTSLFGFGEEKEGKKTYEERRKSEGKGNEGREKG